MPKLLISFKKRTMLVQPQNFSFARRHAMRFEWLALLAYSRATQPADQGWVAIEDVRRLPLWKGKEPHHIGTNVGRYIEDLEKSGLHLVEARTLWRGPYRLTLAPPEIEFDLPLHLIVRYLGTARPSPASNRKMLYLFTHSFAHADSLLFRGHLTFDPKTKKRRKLSARQVFNSLAGNESLARCVSLLLFRQSACWTGSRTSARLLKRWRTVRRS